MNEVEALLGFVKSLRRYDPQDDMKVLNRAIEAVADAKDCKEIVDGVCHLDGGDRCTCRHAAERVLVIAHDKQEGRFP